MKKYKCENNEIWNFPLSDFDEKGNCINEISKEIINKNNLIALKDEEYSEYLAEKEKERIAEEERLVKLPTAEELERNKIELVALDLIMLMKEDGVI